LKSGSGGELGVHGGGGESGLLEFIEPDTSTDSEGEYQYNSDDERSQSSGANDENESTEGDDEDEDDLSSFELEALRTLSIDNSPRNILSLSREKDFELPLVRSSVETGQCIDTRRVCGYRSTYGVLPGRRVSEGDE
jgi:hypothetical protein